jgi:hypothetical protein
MGAPTSAILVETFIQHLEHTIIYQIIDYYRYVDDVLIIYNEEYTNIENTLDEFNGIHPKIKFMMERETQNRINYLDMTVIKAHNKLTFNIYRKPTTTDSIIHNDSCHPNEHKKKSAINYSINLMNTYPLTQENKDHELTIINEILKNNGYQQLLTTSKYINKAPVNPTQTPQNTQKDKTKWATFTYFGAETRTITNLFRNTNLKNAYKTTSTIKHHLQPKGILGDIYNQSGIYQLQCNECPLKYSDKQGTHSKSVTENT